MFRRVHTAGLFAAGVMLGMAPVALAEPLPGPEPVPAPAPAPGSATSECQNGEVLQDGNCIPNMTASGNELGMPASETPLRVTNDETTSVQSGLPADQVPSLDGSPCNTGWVSGACYEMDQNPGAPVVPRSTLSSSP